MFEPTGRIVELDLSFHADDHPFPNVMRPLHTHYRWEGGAVADLDPRVVARGTGIRRIMRPGEVFALAQFRLRVVSVEYAPPRRYLVARDGWRAMLYERVWRLAGPLRDLNKRLYLTAVIWGLAYYDHFTVISWRRDLRLFRWLRERAGRSRIPVEGGE